MVAVLVGAALAFLGTGLTVLQSSTSPFWTWLGWALMVLGVLIMVIAGVVHTRRRARPVSLGDDLPERPSIDLTGVHQEGGTYHQDGPITQTVHPDNRWEQHLAGGVLNPPEEPPEDADEEKDG